MSYKRFYEKYYHPSKILVFEHHFQCKRIFNILINSIRQTTYKRKSPGARILQ